MKPTPRQSGFSLVELSIVLLIMGLVLAGLAMPLAVQRENARIADASEQLQSVHDAMLGFALVNGFLPCPATPGSAGLASPSAGGCTTQHGFVPATTLDLNGTRNGDNLLLDPWGSPLRYSVTATDADINGVWDFTAAGEMSAVTLPLLTPDLVICSSATGATATACGAANSTLAGQAPAVLYSLGQDWSSFSSPDQTENVGTTIGGGPTGTSYRIATNVVFVSRGPSDRGGAEYDDQVRWLSANELYGSLVDAGHLP